MAVLLVVICSVGGIAQLAPEACYYFGLKLRGMSTFLLSFALAE
jgi:hypothetical protein